MGFFSFLDNLSAPKAVEHYVSFDIIPPACPRSSFSSRRTVKSTLQTSVTPVPVPMEIVMNILEAAYYDDDLEANQVLLKSCALVCKDWCATAQKFLFRNVTLRTQDAYRSFRKAVDNTSERGKMLGASVVRMHVILDPSQPHRLHAQSFARAVALCPNLYELQLSMYGYSTPAEDVVGDNETSRLRRPAPTLDHHTLEILRTGPQIRALQFNNWSENRQALGLLLDVWSSIRFLTVGGTPPTSLSIPFSGSLEELRMNFSIEPSLDFVKSLLSNSSALRVLELEREPSNSLLEYLIDSNKQTLESIAVPACGAHEQAVALQQCTSLRELRIESPWVSPMVYKKIPDIIEHIAVGVDFDTALQPVIDTVKLKESLKAVTVQVWSTGDSHPQLSALKIACAYRGIDLKMTRDVRVFRAMTRGDPVPSASFPRVKSLQNLHAMLTKS